MIQLKKGKVKTQMSFPATNSPLKKTQKKNTILLLTSLIAFAIISKLIVNQYAGMAELADAHGSGPCESNFMQVQVLLPAP